jgi:choline dehydrogenase-like flavoprotein
MTESWDVVVVGGGSAGCVVAARLSEDPSVSVLLVEAGPDPQPVPEVIADPKRQTELILESPYVRMYDVERPDGSSFPLLSGHVMGGGSAVNNLAAVRPMRADFDAWTAFGDEAWGYDRLLPLMRDIESDPDFAGSPIHGTSGPLSLERPFRFDQPLDPPVRALIDAATDLGIPLCEDMNAPESYGVCASPYNTRDGRRVSTATAFLDPGRDRPNLTILADTTVRRLRLEGRRVVGLELATPAGPRVIDAGEVVLSAGVYHSPQLLMLSGIGPAPELERLGIPVAHALEGIGENYQDHAVVYVTFEGTEDLREEYVIPKVRLLAKSDPSRPLPDLHVFMRPSIRMAGLAPLLPVSIHLLEHRSRGRVTLASTDPDDLPVIDAALVRDSGDVTALLDGIAFVERLTSHAPLSRFYGPRVTPGPGDDLTEHVTTTYITYHHGVGTCRMGPEGDRGAVVDPGLRVHGLDNLTISDASVIPTVPHGNTNIAAILVGEIAAANLADATPSVRDRVTA